MWQGNENGPLNENNLIVHVQTLTAWIEGGEGQTVYISNTRPSSPSKHRFAQGVKENSLILVQNGNAANGYKVAWIIRIMHITYH